MRRDTKHFKFVTMVALGAVAFLAACAPDDSASDGTVSSFDRDADFDTTPTTVRSTSVLNRPSSRIDIDGLNVDDDYGSDSYTTYEPPPTTRYTPSYDLDSYDSYDSYESYDSYVPPPTAPYVPPYSGGGGGYDYDMDNDGMSDSYDYDMDNDGMSDSYDYDMDNDGMSDSYDYDMDNDGMSDSYDYDMDNDGMSDSYDYDMDNDGISD